MPGAAGGANWSGAGVDPRDRHPLRPVGSVCPFHRRELGKSQHPETTRPLVKCGDASTRGAAGLADPFKPPYGAPRRDRPQQGRDSSGRSPTATALAITRVRSSQSAAARAPGRRRPLVTKTLRVPRRRRRHGDRLSTGRRRQDVPRVRQEDRQDRVGNRIACRHDRCTDDLHARRQAVHRRGGLRKRNARRAHRSRVTITSPSQNLGMWVPGLHMKLFGATVALIASAAMVHVAAQTPAKTDGSKQSGKAWTHPRTPWGDPDIQGHWPEHERCRSAVRAARAIRRASGSDRRGILEPLQGIRCGCGARQARYGSRRQDRPAAGR